MRPRFTHSLTISTPGPSTTDPVTGNQIAGPATVESGPGRLSQSPVANVGSQIELMAEQHTVISIWSVLVPAWRTMTSESTVIDDATGRKFAIAGDVAGRPDHKPMFRAAAARLISDMQ